MHVAARMKKTVQEIEAKILSGKGPVFSGTKVCIDINMWECLKREGVRWDIFGDGRSV